MREQFPLTCRMLDGLAGLDRYDEIDPDMVADYLLDFFQRSELAPLRAELEALLPLMTDDGGKKTWRALGAKVHPKTARDSIGMLNLLITQIARRT
jgi:hypothetical protein